MKEINLNITTWKEGKHYVAQCLNLDISSFGKTKKEALDNIYEALELYFEDTPHPEISKIKEPEIIPLTFRYA